MTLRETLDGLVAAWLSGDALRASAFFAPDGIYQEAAGDPIVGREQIANHFTRFFRDGPPWKFMVSEIIVEGEHAAVTYAFEILGASGWQRRAGCAVVYREAGGIALWREYQG